MLSFTNSSSLSSHMQSWKFWTMSWNLSTSPLGELGDSLVNSYSRIMKRFDMVLFLLISPAPRQQIFLKCLIRLLKDVDARSPQNKNCAYSVIVGKYQ